MDNHNFSSDTPITSIKDDLLERSDFATSLSHALSSWKGKDSLVVALHGDWGSGKSSIKNMVLSILSKNNNASPEIIEFNPWVWAGQEKIAKSFYEELASSLGRKDKSKIRKAIARKIKLYGLYLNSGASIISGVSAALPTLFVILSILGIGNILSEDPLYTKILNGFIVLTVGSAAFLKWGGNLAKQFTYIFEEHAKQGLLSLESLKKSIIKDLKKLEKPILIVIDDIDRLTEQETRLVFQIVKANADFPNVAYLLMFQRDVVELKLSDASQNGSEYLEKIIQVPFNIPQIEQTRLENILFSGLNRILEEDEKILKRFDQTRWGNLYHAGLKKYFKTLRNVYRFSSTLSFHFSLHKGDNAFEVNPVDLIGIELLRVFEPNVYKSLSESKELLTTLASERIDKERTEKEVRDIIEKASTGNNNSVREILKQLFPTIDYMFGGYTYRSDSYAQWFKDLRICHKEFFSRYFQFSIPKSDISQSELEQLKELSSDRVAFREKLTSLKEKGQFRSALSQLDTYASEIPLSNSDSLIAAIMDIGDEAENESGGFTGFSSHFHLTRIVLWHLRKEPKAETRGQKIISAFKKSDGLSVMARLLIGEKNRREKKEEESLLFSDNLFKEAKKLFVDKVTDISDTKPDSFLSNMHLAGIIYRWKEFGDIQAIKKWIDKTVNKPETLLQFLDSFTTERISQGMEDHVSKSSSHIDIASIEIFLSYDVIKGYAKDAKKENLNDRQLLVLDTLEKAVLRRERGIPDDEWED